MAPPSRRVSSLSHRLLILAALLLPLPSSALASPARWFDDFAVDLSSMTIHSAQLDGHESSPRFYRDQLTLVAGKGRGTVGLVYQDTSKGSGVEPGEPEQGLMATASFERRAGGERRRHRSAHPPG